MPYYTERTEAILSVFDIDNKVVDVQEIYSPIITSGGGKEYDINTFITNNIRSYSENKVYMTLENEIVESDKALLSIDLAAGTITKTPVLDTDIIKLCSSEAKACRVDSVGNVYDLITGELYTTLSCINRKYISNVMDDITNNIVYISNDGTSIISQGTYTATYPLTSGIIFGSGEMFGLVGDVLIYSPVLFSPTRRLLYVIYA